MSKDTFVLIEPAKGAAHMVPTTLPLTVTVDQPNAKPCTDCGAKAQVMLEVGSTGFSVTTGYECDPDMCPRFKCKHGILWKHCNVCD